MHVGYVVLGKCKQVWARQVQAESAQHVTRTNDESDETSAHQRAAQHTAFHPVCAAPFHALFYFPYELFICQKQNYYYCN